MAKNRTFTVLQRLFTGTILAGALGAGVYALYQTNQNQEDERLIAAFPALSVFASGDHYSYAPNSDMAKAKQIAQDDCNANKTALFASCDEVKTLPAGSLQGFRMELPRGTVPILNDLYHAGARTTFVPECDHAVVSAGYEIKCNDVSYFVNNHNALIQLADEINTPFKFLGVGVTAEPYEGHILIKGVLQRSPAEAAGLQSGDIITHVGMLATDGWDFDTFRETISNPAEPSVRFTVKRGDDTMTIDLTKATLIQGLGDYIVKDEALPVELRTTPVETPRIPAPINLTFWRVAADLDIHAMPNASAVVRNTLAPESCVMVERNINTSFLRVVAVNAAGAEVIGYADRTGLTQITDGSMTKDTCRAELARAVRNFGSGNAVTPQSATPAPAIQAPIPAAPVATGPVINVSGIELSPNNPLEIISVASDSPAARAKVSLGGTITAIDDAPVEGLDANGILARLNNDGSDDNVKLQVKYRGYYHVYNLSYPDPVSSEYAAGNFFVTDPVALNLYSEGRDGSPVIGRLNGESCVVTTGVVSVSGKFAQITATAPNSAEFGGYVPLTRLKPVQGMTAPACIAELL